MKLEVSSLMDNTRLLNCYGVLYKRYTVIYYFHGAFCALGVITSSLGCPSSPHRINEHLVIDSDETIWLGIDYYLIAA